MANHDWLARSTALLYHRGPSAKFVTSFHRFTRSAHPHIHHKHHHRRRLPSSFLVLRPSSPSTFHRRLFFCSEGDRNSTESKREGRGQKKKKKKKPENLHFTSRKAVALGSQRARGTFLYGQRKAFYRSDFSILESWIGIGY